MFVFHSNLLKAQGHWRSRSTLLNIGIKIQKTYFLPQILWSVCYMDYTPSAEKHPWFKYNFATLPLGWFVFHQHITRNSSGIQRNYLNTKYYGIWKTLPSSGRCKQRICIYTRSPKNWQLLSPPLSTAVEGGAPGGKVWITYILSMQLDTFPHRFPQNGSFFLLFF